MKDLPNINEIHQVFYPDNHSNDSKRSRDSNSSSSCDSSNKALNQTFTSMWAIILLGLAVAISLGINSQICLAGIHSAPIIIPAYKIRPIATHPISMYRLFKSSSKGEAVSIPFQIDELNEFSDFVLPSGPLQNQKSGNGRFDRRDELSFMGDDVGPATPPKTWPMKRPPIVYELKIHKPGIQGAVYVGIYFFQAPVISPRKYVSYNQKNAEIRTSKFLYRFDRKNYLVVRGIDVTKKNGATKPIISSSTFYLKADLKYFLTIEANHKEIESKLEAFKVGPIRTIVRVSFSYSMMRLKFDLGMYTEVSFFSNAVFLPAIMYNPLDGGKSLNQGSGFYYGFSVVENPENSQVETNMPKYRETNILDFLSGHKKVEPLYWVSTNSDDYMIYMEIRPSMQMRRTGNVPMFYKENKNAQQMKNRPKSKASPLGKSPVNLAMFFDLTRFTEGEHIVSFRLFFENEKSSNKLNQFKELSYWAYEITRI